VAGWLAHRADARVFSVRYRLAPENVLSAQAQDAAGALRRWPGASLRIAGDSAGALVALWGHAALTAPERQRITSALLIYGAFGLWIPPGPDDPAHEADGLGPRAVAAMYARLDPGHLMPGHPALDPFSPDFALPRKLCLLAAGTDPLLQDSHALAAHATAQGYDTQWILAENLGHGFLSALPDPAAMQPFAKAVQCLSR